MKAKAFALALILCTGGVALGGETFSVNDASYYPEGPLLAKGVLYYAEMPRHRIMAWDGGKTHVFWSQPGCGPTSIAPYGDGGFVVLCHYANKLVQLDGEGKELAEFAVSKDGNVFIGPNDSAADGLGGVYFSASGIFDKRAPPAGAVYYLPPEGSIAKVADGLWYANGVLVHKDSSLLFVSEHLGRRVLAYPILRGGALGEASEFIRLDDLGLEASGYDLAGPDGLEMDEEGNLYICEYGAGRVLVLDQKGRLLKTIPWPEKYITNIALDRASGAIFITAASDNRRPPFPGRVASIPNPLR